MTSEEKLGNKNLLAIKRIDPHAEALMAQPAISALYEFDVKQTKWQKTDVDGPLFVYKRSEPPIHSLMIANRQSSKDFIEPITESLKLRYETPYIFMYRKDESIKGLWFHDKDECERIYFLLTNLSDPSVSQKLTACATQHPTSQLLLHQILIKTSSSSMSAMSDKLFRNPKLMPIDSIVIGGKYTGKVTSLDEAKNHFEFIVQLKSRQSDYEQLERLLRQYDAILHYDPEPSPTSIQKGDYVLCRFPPSELRRCFIVDKISPENQILELSDNDSTAKVLCIDTGVQYTVQMSDECFFALRPPFDRYPPFAVHCTFGHISAIMHPQKKQVLQKHFNDLMSNQTEVELNVLSVHSENFFPSVYQTKVTVRKGIDYVITYPDFFWK